MTVAISKVGIPNPRLPQWHKAVVSALADTTDLPVDVVIGAAAVYPVFSVPAGAVVLDVMWINKVAWTAALTAILGDGDNDDGFLTSALIAPQTDDDTAGVAARLVESVDYSEGRYYEAADTIDMTSAVATAVVGRAEVYVLVVFPELIQQV